MLLNSRSVRLIFIKDQCRPSLVIQFSHVLLSLVSVLNVLILFLEGLRSGSCIHAPWHIPCSFLDLVKFFHVHELWMLDQFLSSTLPKGLVWNILRASLWSEEIFSRVSVLVTYRVWDQLVESVRASGFSSVVDETPLFTDFLLWSLILLVVGAGRRPSPSSTLSIWPRIPIDVYLPSPRYLP